MTKPGRAHESRDAAAILQVLEATFDSLEAFMAQVPGPDRAEEREALDRHAPLIIFFEARPA